MEGAVRAAALQGFDGLVRDCGDDPRRFLVAHGLDGDELRDPESMVSLDALAAMLEDAATALARPTLGLQLGSRQDLSMLGLLAVVIQDAETVHDALRTASRYLFVHSPAYDFAIDDTSRQLPGCVALRFDVSTGPSVSQRQLIDGCLSSTYRLAELLAPIPLRLRGVSLPHTPVGSRSDYSAHFGAPTFFEQPYAALHLDRTVLDASMRSIRTDLRTRAIAYVTSRAPAGDGAVSVRVRSALKSTLGANRGTKAEIADLLDLHPRTLQRRLTGEDTTFEGIRSEVYRAAAWRLLRETTIPLSQVSAALGFSEQSAMTRAVTRWFGATPSAVRQARSAVNTTSR